MVLYDLGLVIFRIYLSIAAIFDRKIRIGLQGRKNLLAEITAHYSGVLPGRKRILIHVSSYGELEQAKPVIESLRSAYPEAHLHLSFFSPSGYRNTLGKYTIADLISYLPFDTKRNIRQFLDCANPDLVLFARYDVWHNFARELKKRNISSILFSATFSDSTFKHLPIFRSIQRQTYRSLSKVLCISEQDRDAFIAYGVEQEKVAIAGDTRYDQVIRRKSGTSQQQIVVSGSLHERLTDENAFVIVAGSTWPGDENVIGQVCKEFVAEGQDTYLILASHEVSESRLASLERTFGTTSRLSFYNGARTIIVDSIGKLFSLYRYAHIAYVGGGFGAGVHNVLEPAVWEVPIIVGPKHERSQEVALLIQRGGAFEVADAESFTAMVTKLKEDPQMRRHAGIAAKAFVEEQAGASEAIMAFVRKLFILRMPS